MKTMAMADKVKILTVTEVPMFSPAGSQGAGSLGSTVDLRLSVIEEQWFIGCLMIPSRKKKYINDISKQISHF